MYQRPWPVGVVVPLVGHWAGDQTLIQSLLQRLNVKAMSVEYSQPTPAHSLSAPPALHWLSTVCPGLIHSTWRPGGLVNVVELRTQTLCVENFKSMVSYFFLHYVWLWGGCTKIIKVKSVDEVRTQHSCFCHKFHVYCKYCKTVYIQIVSMMWCVR